MLEELFHRLRVVHALMLLENLLPSQWKESVESYVCRLFHGS
jgi:hypothetical protein